MDLRFKGLGFKVQGLAFRLRSSGSGCSVQGVGFKV
jgi:hypothetical protein